MKFIVKKLNKHTWLNVEVVDNYNLLVTVLCAFLTVHNVCSDLVLKRCAE